MPQRDLPGKPKNHIERHRGDDQCKCRRELSDAGSFRLRRDVHNDQCQKRKANDTQSPMLQ